MESLKSHTEFTELCGTWKHQLGFFAGHGGLTIIGVIGVLSFYLQNGVPLADGQLGPSLKGSLPK